jgi:membrane-associated phospholipid phosphatase/tRNA A-37 threonylcarbamoyl transferase component Bud32
MSRSVTEPSRRKRHRRPSGEPPALPRSPGWTRAVVVLGVVLLVGVVLSILFRAGFGEQLAADVVEGVSEAAPAWLADLCTAIDFVGGVVFVGVLRVAALIVLAVYRRWRQAVVFLATFVLTEWIVLRLLGVERPAPEGVESLTDRLTFWFPSRPVASLTVTLVGMAFVLLPAGGRRRAALWVAVGLSFAYAIARLVLGADYLIDATYAVLVGFAAPLAAFAAFVPDDVFPVRYSRGGKAAHLDLGGERGRAIVAAMADQLGFTVTEAKAFGLEGSGGSSPLRMRVQELDGYLFAKVYSMSHLRADRWYRIGRTLLYGQLEDEVPFASVRRLVAYEDYALRLLDDVGVRVARSYGIVELTPNREYMLVTEFFEGSKTLGESEIDDTVIDEGLDLVHSLWDQGLAHRDLKPANLLVRDGHLQLVDVSGLEVRPTPWRQAVDLANMMLTLALQSEPDRVYERATQRFTPDEIGEAFAANVGLAVPTQVQQRLKEDPRPLMARFKELAPEHPPISIQRWSVRRIGLLVAAALSGVVLLAMLVDSVLAGL